MADYWAPKTDWTTTDGIGYADLNRFEGNTEKVASAFRRVHGFGFGIDNSNASYDGLLTTLVGACYSDNVSPDPVPIRLDVAFVKNLTAWAVGNGVAFGGMAPAVTVAAHTWYYRFVIIDPVTGTIDIMFDDNVAGTNIAAAAGAFNKKRYIGAFKTGVAGTHSSFNLVEMYSLDGDNVVINPYSLDTNFWLKTIANGFGINDNYNTYTLTSDGVFGLGLPAKIVKAMIEAATGTTKGCRYGWYSLVGPGGVPPFTVPATMGTTPRAEHYFEPANPASGNDETETFEFMVNAAGQVSIALENSTDDGQIVIAIRGYHDDRIV